MRYIFVFALVLLGMTALLREPFLVSAGSPVDLPQQPANFPDVVHAAGSIVKNVVDLIGALGELETAIGMASPHGLCLLHLVSIVLGVMLWNKWFYPPKVHS